MGARYNWTIPLCAREQEICIGRGRLLYQMDRNRSLGKHQDMDVKKFEWKKIITSFGVPRVLI